MGWVVYGIVIVRMMHYALEREYSWTIKRVSGKACRVTLQGDATTSPCGGCSCAFLLVLLPSVSGHLASRNLAFGSVYCISISVLSAVVGRGRRSYDRIRVRFHLNLH